MVNVNVNIGPRVHYNGTPASVLLEGYVAAADAVREAMAAVNATAPNARDYYPLGADAFNQAHREHGDNLAALADVLSWLTAQAEYVSDQMT